MSEPRYRLQRLYWLLCLLLFPFAAIAADPPARLQVTVANAIDGAPIAHSTVGLWEQVSAGTDVPLAHGTTDSEGHLDIDWKASWTGRELLLKATPYGRVVRSAPVTAPGPFLFEVGFFEEDGSMLLQDSIAGLNSEHQHSYCHKYSTVE